MSSNAIGMIETKGYVAALAAADAMVNFANDPTLAAALGRNGYDLVRQKLPAYFDVSPLAPWLSEPLGDASLHLARA